ncbi:hypothetical protein I4F81_010760 [Pyropia yezoensis]|uniref:Uncharacterized protein n=1 Tax=Pyropia yezoensis TaxID=2788 RepID=A0ACC3CDK5_PYRYE|nr:hypothetical protein I4F81_010760 [Neopyropia yezoensis]
MEDLRPRGGGVLPFDAGIPLGAAVAAAAALGRLHAAVDAALRRGEGGGGTAPPPLPPPPPPPRPPPSTRPPGRTVPPPRRPAGRPLWRASLPMQRRAWRPPPAGGPPRSTRPSGWRAQTVWPAACRRRRRRRLQRLPTGMRGPTTSSFGGARRRGRGGGREAGRPTLTPPPSRPPTPPMPPPPAVALTPTPTLTPTLLTAGTGGRWWALWTGRWPPGGRASGTWRSCGSPPSTPPCGGRPAPPPPSSTPTRRRWAPPPRAGGRAWPPTGPPPCPPRSSCASCRQTSLTGAAPGWWRPWRMCSPRGGGRGRCWWTDKHALVCGGGGGEGRAGGRWRVRVQGGCSRREGGRGWGAAAAGCGRSNEGKTPSPLLVSRRSRQPRVPEPGGRTRLAPADRPAAVVDRRWRRPGAGCLRPPLAPSLGWPWRPPPVTGPRTDPYLCGLRRGYESRVPRCVAAAPVPAHPRCACDSTLKGRGAREGGEWVGQSQAVISAA